MKCLICGKDYKNLETHIRGTHKMSKEDYSKQFNYNGPFMISVNKGKKMTEEQKEKISQKTKEAMQRPEVKEKLGKVALNFHMHDRPEVRKKMRQTMLERYGTKMNFWGMNSEKYNEFKDILFSKEDLIKTIDRCEHELGYKPSTLDLAEYIGCCVTTIYKKINEFNIQNLLSFKESRLENIVKDFLDKNQINYIQRDRKQIAPQELDFYLPEYRIALEVNDTYSHNSTYPSYRGKEPMITKYHQNKTLSAINKNIHLIHLYEWEILNTELFNKIQKYILNLIGNNIKIYARNCDCKEVSKTEARKFYNENHLQGATTNLSTNIGLYYNDKLISCMSFGKPRFNNNYDWELLRYANKIGYSIVGAASRLFKHFLIDYKPKAIISYCDLDKMSGNVYSILGFKEERVNLPTYTWTKHLEAINWKVVLDRGVDNLFGTNYGKGVNNDDLMINKLGYVRVYNAGTKVYVYENK